MRRGGSCRRRSFAGTASSSSGMPPERVLRFLLTKECLLSRLLVGPESSPRGRRVCRDVRFARRRRDIGSRSAHGASSRFVGTSHGRPTKSHARTRPGLAPAHTTGLDSDHATARSTSERVGRPKPESMDAARTSTARMRRLPLGTARRHIGVNAAADSEHTKRLRWCGSLSSPAPGRISKERPGYVPRLGLLVNARGLLHQSKPSFEATHVNAPGGICKPDFGPAGQERSGSRRGGAGTLKAPFPDYPSLRPKRDPTPHIHSAIAITTGHFAARGVEHCRRLSAEERHSPAKSALSRDPQQRRGARSRLAEVPEE